MRAKKYEGYRNLFFFDEMFYVQREKTPFFAHLLSNLRSLEPSVSICDALLISIPSLIPLTHRKGVGKKNDVHKRSEWVRGFIDSMKPWRSRRVSVNMFGLWFG